MESLVPQELYPKPPVPLLYPCWDPCCTLVPQNTMVSWITKGKLCTPKIVPQTCTLVVPLLYTCCTLVVPLYPKPLWGAGLLRESLVPQELYPCCTLVTQTTMVSWINKGKPCTPRMNLIYVPCIPGIQTKLHLKVNQMNTVFFFFF